MNIRICEDTQGETAVVIHCERISDETLRLRDHIQKFGRQLTGRTANSRVEVLDLSEVLYFESVDGRTFACTEKAVLEVGERLYELESRLGECGFARISKSVIANLCGMRAIQPDLNRTLLVTMCNGERLHVSRRCAAVLRDRLRIGRRK